MSLELMRPLVSVDVETTGVIPIIDRIVAVGAVKRWPDGRRERRAWLVNPGVPIPPASTEIHGITDAMVADAPPLRAVAGEIAAFLEGCDLAGFGAKRFDVVFLSRELAEAGCATELESRAMVDVKTLYHQLRPRTLADAYRDYAGGELVDAHVPDADADASLAVLDGMLQRHPELPRTVEGLAALTSAPVRDEPAVDPDARLLWDRSGEIVMAFGKHRGRRLAEVAASEPDFCRWMLARDFTAEVKAAVRAALAGKCPTRTAAAS